MWQHVRYVSVRKTELTVSLSGLLIKTKQNWEIKNHGMAQEHKKNQYVKIDESRKLKQTKAMNQHRQRETGAVLQFRVCTVRREVKLKLPLN